MASGPLSGIRVLEFSQVIAAPLAGQILADMGAEVLKVEPPEGESWRLQVQFVPGESKAYQCLNRGKRGMTLRLDRPAAQQVVHQLVREMDVVLINYRPDVPKRFAIDYETLSAIKPDLVYIDLTAFGRKGPWALRPGYDGAVQAVSGLMAGEGKIRVEDGSPMTVSSTAMADYGTGIVMADAAIAALYHRDRTGRGQMVECSLLATALNMQGSVIMEHPEADRALRNPQRDQRRRVAQSGASYQEMIELRESVFRHAADPFHAPYLTRNGALVIAAQTHLQRSGVYEVLNLDQSVHQERPQLAAVFSTRRTEEWIDALATRGVPCSPVHFPEEMTTLQQVLDNDWIVEMEHDTTGPQSQLGPLLRFSATPLDTPSASPPLGRDTHAVLGTLGYSAADIARLQEEGVI